MFVNEIITFKLRISSIVIDIISNYYNDRLWSECPLNGTFLNYNIAHSIRVLSRVMMMFALRVSNTWHSL